MKKLEANISIAAPRQKVWDTMLNPETYKEWTGAAWPGSYYEGRWEEGESLRFIGPDGSGTLVTLLEHRPYSFSRAEHIAILQKGGGEDRDSKEAKDWIGSTESYTFTDTPGGTELKTEMHIAPEFVSMFEDSWPKALAKLKEICER